MTTGTVTGQPPPAGSRAPIRRHPWLDGICCGLAAVAVVWFFGWTVASGGGFAPAGEDDLYHLLVRGYRQGQLHLDRAPTAELRALADPYDPAQNGPHRLPDVSYYRGHYYLYFGVTPAVVAMLPYAWLTGRDLPTGAAVFVFCVAGFLAACGLWLALRQRYFPTSAWWTGALGVLVLGFGTHVLALARRPMVWELPIAAGYAFAMAALLAVYAAIHGRRPLPALTAAGICVGLAMAARPPLLFGAALLVAPAWLVLARCPRPGAGWWRVALAAGGGIVACGLAMLWHNHARFDSAFEFGQNLQLTAAKELTNRHFGLDYIRHNFGVYYFHAPRWSWEFPYIAATTPGWSIADYAGSEEMCGLLVTLPFLALALAAPLAWGRRPLDEARPLRALVGAVAGLYLGVGTFLLAFFSTTERYVAEFAPALALLALVGWLGVERRLHSARGRHVVLALTAIAGLATVPVGALISLNYHGNAFQRDNPAVWSQLARRSELALAQAGLWLGEFTGPRVLKVRFAPLPPGTIETFWKGAATHGNERILIERLADRTLRFGHARDDLPAITWGRAVTWSPAHSHTVELQLPSLYAPATGWMSGLRRGVEFRERSSFAVWFSGERVLDGIVPPPPGFAPGGAVPPDFAGEIRRRRVRLFQDGETHPDPAAAIAVTPEQPAGAVLRLRLRFPDALIAAGEPLFAAGDLYGSDIVFVREGAAGTVQVVYERYGTPQVPGLLLRLDRGLEHTVEIALPPPVGGVPGTGTAGTLTVHVNGVEVLRAAGTASGFSSDSVRIGRNPFDTTCGPEFRGWLLAADWSQR